MRKIIASLDIGTSTIKLIVGEFIKNSLNILCVSEVPSRGVKKGLIVNRDELIPVLKETFHKAEEVLGIPVKEVVLGIPAYYTDVTMSEGVSTITNEDHVIMHQDLIRAMHAASYNKINEDSELVSIIPTRYKVDDDLIVKNPINMIAKKLALKAVLITAPKSTINSFVGVLDKIGIKVIDVVVTPLADYATNRNKDTGKYLGAIINIGDETTTVSIVNKGILTKVFPSSLVTRG